MRKGEEPAPKRFRFWLFDDFSHPFSALSFPRKIKDRDLFVFAMDGVRIAKRKTIGTQARPAPIPAAGPFILRSVLLFSKKDFFENSGMMNYFFETCHKVLEMDRQLE